MNHCEHERAPMPFADRAHSDARAGHTMASHADMECGSADTYLRRFWIVTALLVPLALTSTPAAFLRIPAFSLAPLLQFGIATAIFGFALVFFEHAWHEIQARAFGMMTLVSLAVGAGYAFSVVATFVPSLGVQFYLEISTLIWVLLFGHYLEARSSAAAGDALGEVAKLLPRTAHRLLSGAETDVDVAELAEGDTVMVKPGEKIPADGAVRAGRALVNESLISGESRPVEKKTGATVIAGSIALDGALTVRLSRVGAHSTVGQIQTLIASAQMTKPRQARIADTASAVLTFVALAVALLTLLIWSLVAGSSFAFAATLAITVLVIACPHALGLAIPTVTTIATSLAVKNGVFVKNLAKIETIRKADYIIFDKTGTLTDGSFGVTAVLAFGGTSKDEALRVAASLEQNSSHVIGRSILAYAKQNGTTLAAVSDFENVAGKGIRASIAHTRYLVGNAALMEDARVALGAASDALARYASEGATVVFVADAARVIGLIALADKVKPESKAAVRALHGLGLKVALLTGDHAAVAKSVARELSIDTYFAEVLPEEKYARVKELQEKGSVVLMVGDGVNDAPALAQADAGLAIAAGTDVAVEAGDVVLTRSNPADVVRLIVLARAVYRKMLQNLWWALGYNVLAIPAAAGVFASPVFFGGFYLRPEIGALLMSLSTVIVVANALSLRRLNLKNI